MFGKHKASALLVTVFLVGVIAILLTATIMIVQSQQIEIDNYFKNLAVVSACEGGLKVGLNRLPEQEMTESSAILYDEAGMRCVLYKSKNKEGIFELESVGRGLNGGIHKRRLNLVGFNSAMQLQKTDNLLFEYETRTVAGADPASDELLDYVILTTADVVSLRINPFKAVNNLHIASLNQSKYKLESRMDIKQKLIIEGDIVIKMPIYAKEVYIFGKVHFEEYGSIKADKTVMVEKIQQEDKVIGDIAYIDNAQYGIKYYYLGES